MSAFSEFFLMKPDDVKRYAVEVLHRFEPDEETACTEIGDGNINYVFQVRSLRDGRSVIVKQADKLLRSSGRPLDIYRSRIEAQALQLESRLAPDYLPEVYHYDETMAALSMEDISAYKNLRKELLAGSEYSVTEISELLGFESVTYFERVFKKLTDKTPLKYRRICSGDMEE